MNSKILLAEDDLNFGDVLKSYLELNGYVTDLAQSGIKALEHFRNKTYNICIFDVMMPGMDGFQLATEIRKTDSAIPIIFLTARSLKEDIIEGFKIGADDYITKPFNSEELLYRIKAILKRSESENAEKETNEFKIGRYFFDFPLRILSIKDKNNQIVRQKLSPKEAELLKLLCKHQNKVLPREITLKQIWNKNDYFTARSMDVFITKLRKYLELDDTIKIDNIHGNGFRLVVEETIKS
ncbi:MAG: response regulator transcription factor [Deltaproteobacteria bacterium]